MSIVEVENPDPVSREFPIPVTGTQPVSQKCRRNHLRIVLCVCALAFALKGVMSQRSAIGPDEFQHLHAAWCVAQGQTPYLDFFEHHPPFLYYLLLPLFWMLEPGFELIVAARGLMLALNVGIMALTYRLARVGFGRRTARWALLLLASDVLFFENGLWVLTDVPAALLTLTSTYFLTRAGQTQQYRWFLAASFALGSAVLFTPKVVYCALAVITWFAVYLGHAWQAKRMGQGLRRAALYLAAGMGPLGLLVILIGPHAFPAFWENNVVLNLAWKARHSPLPHMRHMLVTNGPLWVAAAVGFVLALVHIAGSSNRWHRAGPTVLTFASLVVGAALLPVVWEEYFVGVVPYGAILGAYGLRHIAERLSLLRQSPRQKGVWAAAFAAAMLALALGYDLFRAIEKIEPVLLVMAVGTMVALTVVAGFRIRERKPRLLSPCVLLLVMVLPFALQLSLVHNASNEEHREALAFVMAQSAPTEKVFDGYMGYGLFRPHAHWWWFLHDEVLLMLSERERGEVIVESLEQARPKVVLYDCWVEQLEPSVQAYLRNHYRPTSFFQIWIRKAEE